MNFRKIGYSLLACLTVLTAGAAQQHLDYTQPGVDTLKSASIKIEDNFNEIYTTLFGVNLTAWAGKTAPSGTVVGTSDVQTLTNKSISGGQITSAVASATLATTATALAANGANCSAGSYPLGVDQSGAAESCTSLGGLTGLANPSATIGLTAINGSATTAMRSDGAPALNVGIAPTWTGLHTWSLDEPRLILSESDQASDLKLWDFDVNGAVLTGRTRSDADGAGVNWLAVARGATTAIASINFGNATNNPGYQFLGTGTVTLNGALNATSTAPNLVWTESDAGTNLKPWQGIVNGGVFRLRTVTDALGAGSDFLSATRGPTTAIASVAFGNVTDNPTYSLLGTGAVDVGGALTMTKVGTNAIPTLLISSTAPIAHFNKTNSGADAKRWYMNADTANTIAWGAANDAASAFRNYLAVTRNSSSLALTAINIGNATDNAPVSLLTSGDFTVPGNIVNSVAGSGIKIKEGSNATLGTCTLSAGACTVSTTKVTANSRIFLTAQALGTVTVGQGLAVSARTAGTSFTVTSGDPTDTSTVAWWIIEPSP